MRIKVGDVHLYFDVDGPALAPHGDVMIERPTMVLLHGGPGADHSLFKPEFAALAELAQIVYLDQRGSGRSDAGPPATWTRQQWADDVAAFCRTLGITRPVLVGTSSGALVALRCAADQAVTAWKEHALPVYGDAATQADMHQRRARARLNEDVQTYFRAGACGSAEATDYLPTITCPTLILAGEHDPVVPAAATRRLAASLPHATVTRRILPGVGHGTFAKRPRRPSPTSATSSPSRPGSRPRGRADPAPSGREWTTGQPPDSGFRPWSGRVPSAARAGKGHFR